MSCVKQCYGDVMLLFDVPCSVLLLLGALLLAILNAAEHIRGLDDDALVPKGKHLLNKNDSELAFILRGLNEQIDELEREKYEIQDELSPPTSFSVQQPKIGNVLLEREVLDMIIEQDDDDE